MSNPMQDLHALGLNPFAVTLLAESMLKSAYVKHRDTEPLTFEFPVRRDDCEGWAGVRITIEAVRANEPCPLCGYQHGHAIGCANNPVDIALAPGAALPAPLGWWTDELEKIYTAKAGTPITLDMKRAAHMALTVAHGGRWDDEKQEWTHGVAASDHQT